MRETAHLTIEQVAESLGFSSSKISRIETARVRPTPGDVREMVELYGVTERLEEMRQIARDARQRRGVYANYGDMSEYMTYAELEADAETIKMYSELIVPGLFQTPEYARAVLRAIRLKPQPEEIERRVEFRLARQKRLTEEHTPAVWAVLDEAVLRRMVGGPEVMRAQLEHLTEVAGLPNVDLQVVPFASGEHAGMDGPFAVISFPETVDPAAVHIENTMSDLYLEAADAIRRYATLFDHLRAAALDPGKSLAFIVNVAKELQPSN